MTTARVFVIRDRTTGGVLPARKGRGFTNDEPIVGAPPRLFWKRSHAQIALTVWLKGRHVAHRGSYDNGLDGPEYDEDLEIIPVASRKVENMEIVEFSLEEVKA